MTPTCKLYENWDHAIPFFRSECDVQADVREIVKIERFNYESEAKATEAVSFADQLELPLTGHNQSSSEPLQDDAGNHTSGSV